jgi:branched-subunit amino acid aminotransferase/4-amino-4-deoxychorismate lyase
MRAIEIDGMTAGVELLERRLGAEVDYTTTFLVTDGRVRGLDLHLERLRDTCRDPLGLQVDAELVDRAVRAFVRAHSGSYSVRVELFCATDEPVERVLVMGRDLPVAPVRPLRLLALASAELQSGIGRRRAHANGFDDLLVYETDATICGSPAGAIGFLSRNRVIWPQGAPASVEQILLAEQLQARRVSSVVLKVCLDDLGLFDACFVVGDHGISLIDAVDDVRLSTGEANLDELRHAFADIPWQTA